MNVEPELRKPAIPAVRGKTRFAPYIVPDVAAASAAKLRGRTVSMTSAEKMPDFFLNGFNLLLEIRRL